MAGPVLGTTDADTGTLGVEVNATILGQKEAGGLWTVLVELRVIFLVHDLKVAVGAAEHVLLLGDGTLDIRPAGDIGVRHVEDSEALAVRGRQGAGHLAPVTGKHLDPDTGMRLR
jgi:hypothetical protein